jgi:hypothetical protein
MPVGFSSARTSSTKGGKPAGKVSLDGRLEGTGDDAKNQYHCGALIVTYEAPES